MKKESKIKKQILNKLRERFPKSVWYKIHGGPQQERGLPDIIGCHKGTFCGIEVKRPTRENQLTEYQKFQLDKIKKAGGKSTVVSSPEAAVDFILKHF